MMKYLAIGAAALIAATSANGSTLDLSRGAAESLGVQLFAEKQRVAVDTNEIQVDFLVGGNVSVGDSFVGVDEFVSGSSLQRGFYDSFLLHFDPTGVSGGTDFGTVAFRHNIVAIILSNGATLGGPALLNASDAKFGTAVAYDTSLSRRSETTDNFELVAANQLNFDFTTSRDFIDNARVITETAPIPLPASLPLLLAGLGGMVWTGRRRRSAVS